MDLALALDLLSPHPGELDTRRASCAGALTPVVIPLGWLDAETRGAWLVGDELIPLHMRVSAALDADQEATAWHLIAARRGAPLIDPQLASALRTWAGRRQAALRLPATGSTMLVVRGGGRLAQRGHVAEAALRDVQALFAPLLWPRWSGPVVVVVGDDAVGELDAERELVARPALPLLRLRQEPADDGWREALAAACAELVLALEQGQDPWPAWFQHGMVALARARARGEGPSPRAMLAIRSRAGAEGIQRCLLAEIPDIELSLALCAWAGHPRRARQLGPLMEVLRNGADGISAFEIAYGATPADLAAAR